MSKNITKTDLNYTIESIDSSLLEVLREDYQKPLNEKRVAQIVASFDENIANEPKVSYRDGHYYVFDGQHTLAARIMLNGGKAQRIRCKVYRNLKELQEYIKEVLPNNPPNYSEKEKMFDCSDFDVPEVFESLIA